MVKGLSTELARDGIRVNCVAPGWVATDMAAPALNDPATREKVFATIPLRRVAHAGRNCRAHSVPVHRTRRVHHRGNLQRQRRRGAGGMRLQASGFRLVGFEKLRVGPEAMRGASKIAVHPMKSFSLLMVALLCASAHGARSTILHLLRVLCGIPVKRRRMPTRRRPACCSTKPFRPWAAQAWLNLQDMEQQGRSYGYSHGQPSSLGTVFWRFWKYPDKDRIELTKQRDVVLRQRRRQGIRDHLQGNGGAGSRAARRLQPPPPPLAGDRPAPVAEPAGHRAVLRRARGGRAEARRLGHHPDRRQ